MPKESTLDAFDFFRVLEDYQAKPHRKKVSRKTRLRRETTRILKHLPTRDLNQTSYRALYNSAIAGIRTLDDLDQKEGRPDEQADRRFVYNISIALFGQESIRRGGDFGGQTPVLDAEVTRGLLAEPEPTGTGKSPEASLGNPEDESEGRPRILRPLRDD
jgi:hypothetical protein